MTFAGVQTMTDPFAEVVTLLQPKAPFSKISRAGGSWCVRRTDVGQPFYCAVIEGQMRVAIDGRLPLVLESGDFLLIPSSFPFTASSLVPPERLVDSPHEFLADGEVRLGDPQAEPSVRMLVGHCAFGSPDAGLLLSLLPEVVLVKGQTRLATLMALLRDESRNQRPARDVVLAHLLEVLFIEALRSSTGDQAFPGILRGLADERLAGAIRAVHDNPARPWTVVELARVAGLSRSTFFTRFSQEVGVSPMKYLLNWRMAVAKDLLRRRGGSVAEVAAKVGYQSASAFSVAFSRATGAPPTRFARGVAPPRG